MHQVILFNGAVNMEGGVSITTILAFKWFSKSIIRYDKGITNTKQVFNCVFGGLGRHDNTYSNFGNNFLKYSQLLL